MQRKQNVSGEVTRSRRCSWQIPAYLYADAEEPASSGGNPYLSDEKLHNGEVRTARSSSINLVLISLASLCSPATMLYNGDCQEKRIERP